MFAPSGDGWFIRYEDGTTQWEGMPDHVHELMAHNTVAWCSFWGDEGFYVQFQDGSYQAAGLPAALPAKLIDVGCVSVSEDAQSYFVRANGQALWSCGKLVDSLSGPTLSELLSGWLPQTLPCSRWVLRLLLLPPYCLVLFSPSLACSHSTQEFSAALSLLYALLHLRLGFTP